MSSISSCVACQHSLIQYKFFESRSAGKSLFFENPNPMAQNKWRPVCFNLITYKLYICSLPLTFGATTQLAFEIAHEPFSALKSIAKSRVSARSNQNSKQSRMTRCPALRKGTTKYLCWREMDLHDDGGNYMCCNFLSVRISWFTLLHAVSYLKAKTICSSVHDSHLHWTPYFARSLPMACLSANLHHYFPQKSSKAATTRTRLCSCLFPRLRNQGYRCT